MLYFRKGGWHDGPAQWEEPLFQAVRHLADGYFVDAVLAGHSPDAATAVVEKRLYPKILYGSLGKSMMPQRIIKNTAE
jgi:hypothetical protein